MNTRTRFAPSPTGFLHIGGARTALFNYLFAKHTGGKFLLRIEDTDLQRSTQQAVDAIINGLSWLNLNHDEEIVYQMQRQERHIEVAQELLHSGNAYKCFCTKEDLDKRRKQAEAEGKVYVYDGRCREITDFAEYEDKPFAIRLKVNKEGSTIIKDLVKGEVEVQNNTLDDLIILRSDNVPTYMFAVVIDDHDMDITHIIRGDDHFTNAFRQYQIYKAFEWKVPEFAHLPLIHAMDGSKLSKRHGAISVESYKDLGFLPEAICNYLLKLGWSHGDDEIITPEQAIAWFDIVDVNVAPAKFDMVKLTSINHHYIQNTPNERLLELMEEFVAKENGSLNANYKSYLLQGLTSIKERSKTILELVENSSFYLKKPPFIFNDKAIEVLNNSKDILKEQFKILNDITDWTKDSIHNTIKEHCDTRGIKLGKASEGLRVALTGKTVSASSNFDIMVILGKEETLSRISTALA
ncbi:MAG: glutamate--tRNA ligase [Alphaproteobacteria bacterium]|jgi:glutamyl-tRNA synthetase|nr:glutamate--tRNA ligase [Alphaproteobacteria bacterium]